MPHFKPQIDHNRLIIIEYIYIYTYRQKSVNYTQPTIYQGFTISFPSSHHKKAEVLQCVPAQDIRELPPHLLCHDESWGWPTKYGKSPITNLNIKKTLIQLAYSLFTNVNIIEIYRILTHSNGKKIEDEPRINSLVVPKPSPASESRGHSSPEETGGTLNKTSASAMIGTSSSGFGFNQQNQYWTK